MEKLTSDFDNHRNNFKEEKLMDLIHPSIRYQFTKLYENIQGDYPLVKINFSHIFETYNDIKNGIILRYSSLSALSNIEMTTQMLDYLFIRVRRDLIDNKIEDQLELRIIIDALKWHFEDLKAIVIEIDKEFE